MRPLLALLALFAIGCEDRPRTSADGPQLVTPAIDLAAKDLSSKADLAKSDEDVVALVNEAVALIKQLDADLTTCTTLERSHFKQLQQCRRECGGKDMGR